MIPSFSNSVDYHHPIPTSTGHLGLHDPKVTFYQSTEDFLRHSEQKSRSGNFGSSSRPRSEQMGERNRQTSRSSNDNSSPKTIGESEPEMRLKTISSSSDRDDVSPSGSSGEVTSILSKGSTSPLERKHINQSKSPRHLQPIKSPRELQQVQSPRLSNQHQTNWTSLCDPRAISPYQVPDHTVELRNQLYRAALLQNSSPFMPTCTLPPYPPGNFFPRQSLPPGQDTLQSRLPFPLNCSPSSSFQPIPPRSQPRQLEPGISHNKRKLTTPSPQHASLDTAVDRINTINPFPSVDIPVHYHLPPPASSPTHFTRGSLIQLADGNMKKVEELEAEDFIRSANNSQEVSIDQSTLIKLEPVQSSGICLLTFCVGKTKAQVVVSAGQEHPFFVIGRGWSSFNPPLSLSRYNLVCSQLGPGDICISLAKLPTESTPANIMMQTESTPAHIMMSTKSTPARIMMPPPDQHSDVGGTIKRRRMSSISPETPPQPPPASKGRPDTPTSQQRTNNCHQSSVSNSSALAVEKMD